MQSVTKAICLRSAFSPQSLRPLVVFSSSRLQTQLRTATTQIQPPTKIHKSKAASGTAASSKNPKTSKQSNKSTGYKRIKWSKVDFDAIEIPSPKNPEPQLHVENGKTYHKHPKSRKVYLHTLYTNLLLRTPLLLFFNTYGADQHTLLKLRFALQPLGVQMKVIRRRIFLNALRVAEYVEETRAKELWDPSGLAMRAKILPRRRSTEELEMKTLLKGSSTCVASFEKFNWRPESIDPAQINAVVRLIERTGKTSIVGARFHRTVISGEDVKRLRTLPKAEAVNAELVGLLGGAAQTLAGTLSTPASGLAFTLEGRHKAMEEEQGGKIS